MSPEPGAASSRSYMAVVNRKVSYPVDALRRVNNMTVTKHQGVSHTSSWRAVLHVSPIFRGAAIRLEHDCGNSTRHVAVGLGGVTRVYAFKEVFDFRSQI
jgi:hypothetical protein